MVLGKLDNHMQRMKLDHFSVPYTKINLKWIKDSNVRPETIKLLGKNLGSKLFDPGLSNIFLDMSPQKKAIKAKINKLDYIKRKSFCTAKETINKMKRQPTAWEKVFANCISNKGLISKIYNNSYNSLFKKQTTRLKNGQRT